MSINKDATALKGQIEEELRQYLTETVAVSEDYEYSQAKLVRRISLFENHIYPTGKFDKQGNYKYWYDIITPAIDAEVKNIDFDTKDINVYSSRKNDELPCIVTNLKTKEYLRETGQAEEINSAIEEGAGRGNILWKKVNKSYERTDLNNVYIINQTAECVDETPIIERHQLTSKDLREKDGTWEDIEDVIKNNKSSIYKATVATQGKATTVPYYEMFERNGEVCLKDLKETNNETAKEGDENKFVLARVIAAGTSNASGVTITHIVFAKELKNKKMSDIYKEYHRSRYKGRWFREGLYELCFDIQVRANQVGNQLAQGLEFASKKILWSPDKLIMQSIVTDLKSGDIIKASNLQSVDLRMDGFDQLANEWNRLIEMRNEIANSHEVVTGDAVSNQPFRLGALLNQNANKLFDFIREKLSIPFSEMFEQWIIPDLIKELKTEEILRLTGDSDMLQRLCSLVVDNWYLENLLSFPPHTNQDAVTIKAEQVKQLMGRPQILMKGLQEVFEGFKPNVSVIITGEQIAIDSELQTLSTFVQFEMDPVRRSAIVELMAKKKGLDFGSLPKSPPQPLAPPEAAKVSPLKVNRPKEAAAV
jgi:hypothetical protein